MGTQEEAIELIDNGENVHLTGPAGSGKTYVINQIIDNNTIVCAPTGAAALLIEGATCHSIFNLPIGLITEDERFKLTRGVERLFSDSTIKKIIIDETSMLRADYFDCINYRLQRVKRNNLPFGGLQVITVADWFQLPPIVNNKERRYFRRMYKSPFAFGSETWNKLDFKSVVLDKIYRQEDQQQQALLNSIRIKDDNWKHAIDRLNNDWCEIKEDPEKITLCNYLEDSNEINDKFYSQINSKEFIYEAIVVGNFKEKDIKQAPVDEIIKLKVGAKVLICSNDKEKTYVNGQRGVVRNCYLNSTSVELENGNIVEVVPHKWEKFKYSKLMGSLTKVIDGTFTQLPIRLGWSVSVHKSQGQSLDGCNLHLGKGCFAPHQLYVGLSRVRNLKNMNLVRKIEYDDLIIDKRVKDFYSKLEG